VKVAVEELEACKRRLAVEAPVDVVQKEWERAYGRVQKQARLPGFRKGHVPRSLVKLHFADDVRREVAEHLIPDVYRQALTEARIDPVNEPDLQEVKLEENAPLSFVAVVEVKPAIALSDYKGLDVQHAPPPVSDDDVARTVEQMREQQAEFRSVDRAAAEGDLVIVDYTLAPEAHDPTTANGYHFVVGSGSVMPEIDAAAVGMRAGEKKEIALHFPDDHRMESLRGKSGTASLSVKEVKEKILPPLDDDFAKSLGQFDVVYSWGVLHHTGQMWSAIENAQERVAPGGKFFIALYNVGVEICFFKSICSYFLHPRFQLGTYGENRIPDTLSYDDLGYPFFRTTFFSRE